MNTLSFLVLFLGLISELLIAPVWCIGRPCGGDVKELTISGCKEEPCLMKQGSTGTLGVVFKAISDSATLTGNTTIRLMDHDLPFPGFKANACHDSNIKCPYAKSSLLHYRYNFRILESYQHMQTHATIKLMNEKKELEACYEFDFKVV